MSDDGKKGSMWTWVAVGCGGLILLGVVGTCVGPGLFAMMFMDGLAGMGPGFGPTPNPNVAPGTAGLELPPPPGPLMPTGSTASAASARKAFGLAVTEVESVEGVSAGDFCPFEVERIPRGGAGYWCRTELRCGDVLLYGGPGQGYFDCSFPELPDQRLEAYDYGVRSDDGDPSFTIDYEGNVIVRDIVDGTTTRVLGRLEPAGIVGRLAQDPETGFGEEDPSPPPPGFGGLGEPAAGEAP